MKKKVIIPSAKIVENELRYVGDIPPIIYPCNQNMVIDYLSEIYGSSNFELNVVAFEAYDSVQKKLANYESINLIKLDKLRSLAYSVYYGLKDVEGAAIINFADTILYDMSDGITPDTIYYAKQEPTNKWTFYHSSNGVITDIADKTDNLEKFTNYEECLFVGVYVIGDTKLFAKLLLESKAEGNVSSFYVALREYSKVHPLKEIEAKNWFDIGHIEEYVLSNIAVKTRTFNQISIDSNRGILCKTSEDIEKFIGEINWYLKLPTDIEYVRPRIFSYSTSFSKPYIKMEYYAYHTLHELMLYGELTKADWERILKKIKFILDDFSRYKVGGSNIVASLKYMYLDKVEERLIKLKSEECFNYYFDNNIKINGKTYYSLDKIISILKSEIPKRLFNIDSFQIIHGDLCFSNIMTDANHNIIKLIDPRGSFGGFDIYGDYRYELAKLMHSIEGKYDYIIKDQFLFDLDNHDITFSIVNDEIKNIYDAFFKVFKDSIDIEIESVRLIEALLFLSMIPLHSESLRQQFVMFATGVELLDKVLEISVAGE